MKLFGSSGIRGLVNVEVTPLLAQKVGAALASQFEGGAIIVGRDTRLSGKMLEAALTSGIASCGIVTGGLGIVQLEVATGTATDDDLTAERVLLPTTFAAAVAEDVACAGA